MVRAAIGAGGERLHLDPGAVDGVDLGLDLDVAAPRSGSSRRPSPRAAGGTAAAGWASAWPPGCPATRATASTSPLVIAPEAIFDAVSGSMCTRQRATARRCVASLAVTSTMRARPSGSRCVNSEADMRGQSRGRSRDPLPTLSRRSGSSSGSGRTKSTWPMRCPAHLVPTARAIAAARVVDRRRPPPRSDRPQVELLEREQAGAELALGGDADAVAAARRTAR